jgi:hypothetical protein
MDLCLCKDPNACDMVCPKAPQRYSRRLDEIGGFGFDNIPVRAFPAPPTISGYIPLVKGKVSNHRTLEMDYIAIPLTHAIKGRGLIQHAKTKAELIRDHGITPRKGWIVTGIEDDRQVERIWKLNNHREIFQGLKDAGVVLATVSNLSLYADCPRHDNLHAMKRIALLWFIMNDAGLPTALHINGRTDHDFERWAAFIERQYSITTIAFEFLTGAKPLDDANRYCERLIALARRVKRPLTLVLRSSLDIANRLRPEFHQLVWLSATPYIRTVKRHQAIQDEKKRLQYKPRGGNAQAPIGSLFKANVIAEQRRYAGSQFLYELTLKQPSLALQVPDSPPDMDTDDESPQMSLLAP